jgi:formylglycine-generating enzyme required for sulfatase activity
MADIFLSYAHEDADRAADVARLLGRIGWSVFWDRRMPAGVDWDDVIERELQTSKCVVVLWSATSVKSPSVKSEASYAHMRQKLVPAQLDDTEPPVRFHLVEAAQLQRWAADAEHPEFLVLKEGIERHVAPGQLFETKRDVALTPLRGFTTAARSNPPATSTTMLPTARRTQYEGTVRFRADAWNLPDEPLLGFVEIPAGEFTMGEEVAEDDHHAYMRVRQHKVTLPSYYIGRYEVTVAQFKTFTAATSTEVDASALTGPDDYPVRNVSWYEALAYAAWLDGVLKKDGRPLSSKVRTILSSPLWHVTLQSEAEWEKAARGADGRIYPWGDDIDTSRANYNSSNQSGPTPVGSYPDGASPYGVFDLCGNVWEWTRSLWGAGDLVEPYQPGDPNWEDPSSHERTAIARAVRGGSYASARRHLRAGRGDMKLQRDRVVDVGIRLVVTYLLS